MDNVVCSCFGLSWSVRAQTLKVAICYLRDLFHSPGSYFAHHVLGRQNSNCGSAVAFLGADLPPALPPLLSYRRCYCCIVSTEDTVLIPHHTVSIYPGMRSISHYQHILCRVFFFIIRRALMMSLFLSPLSLNFNIDADTIVGERAVCSLDYV